MVPNGTRGFLTVPANCTAPACSSNATYRNRHLGLPRGAAGAMVMFIAGPVTKLCAGRRRGKMEDMSIG